MPWNGNTHIMTAPVGLGDISQAVHYSSLDLGTLITNGIINAAARLKPIAYPAWGILTEAQRRSRNCGMSMDRYGSLNTMYSAAVAIAPGTVAWTYERPRGVSGSINEPFRVLDFDGYDENAGWMQYGIFPNPCSRVQTPQVSDEGYIVTPDSINQADLRGDGSVSASGKHYYPAYQYNIGIAYGIKNSGTLIYAKTFSSVPFSITKPGSTSDYDVVCFFTDQTHDGSTTDKNGVYILFPIPHTIWSYKNILGLNYANCELSTNRQSLQMYIGTQSGTASYYKMTVLIKNGSTVTHTIDLNLGRSGTLTTTQTNFGSLNVSPAAVQGATFWLRFWPDSQTSYDEQFFPAETPI